MKRHVYILVMKDVYICYYIRQWLEKTDFRVAMHVDDAFQFTQLSISSI